jgi:hypothetical protein
MRTYHIPYHPSVFADDLFERSLVSRLSPPLSPMSISRMPQFAVLAKQARSQFAPPGPQARSTRCLRTVHSLTV